VVKTSDATTAKMSFTSPPKDSAQPVVISRSIARKEPEYRPTSPPVSPPRPVQTRVEPPKPTAPEKSIEEKPPKQISPIQHRSSEASHPTQRSIAHGQDTTPGFEWPSGIYKLMRFWYPFKLKLEYPRRSSLCAFEQKEFIEFHNKFKSRTKVTQQEVKFYKKYLVNIDFVDLMN
jgi:hypothetical protein